MDETNDGRDEEERILTGSSSRGGASDGVMNQIPAARGWVKQQGRLCLSRGELQSTYSVLGGRTNWEDATLGP